MLLDYIRCDCCGKITKVDFTNRVDNNLYVCNNCKSVRVYCLNEVLSVLDSLSYATTGKGINYENYRARLSKELNLPHCKSRRTCNNCPCYKRAKELNNSLIYKYRHEQAKVVMKSRWDDYYQNTISTAVNDIELQQPSNTIAISSSSGQFGRGGSWSTYWYV